MSAERARLDAGRPFVAAEIGSDWLKLALLEPGRSGPVVSRLHLERIDPSAGPDPKALAAALKRVRSGRVPVIGCLPRQMVNVRMLELPSTDPHEVADMVELQAGKQTPYSRDEIVSDFRQVGASHDGYTNIMLAIVQRSVVRQRFHAFEEAGVELDQMSVSTEGLLNWALAQAGGGGTLALVDVDSFYTDFSVVSGGRMLSSRSILTGANQLMGEWDKWRDRYVAEIQRTLEACRSEHAGVTIDRLVLSGAGVNIRELPAALTASGLKVEVKDSTKSARKMPASPLLSEGAFASVSLTALIGMGMDPGRLEFNLVPDSVRLRRGLMEKARSMTTFGILLMTLLLSASLYATQKVYLKKQRLAGVTRECVELEPKAKRVEAMHDVVKAMRQRQDLRGDMLTLLAEVQRQVPKEAVLDTLDIDVREGRGLVEGIAGTRQDVRTVVQNMEQSSFFKNAREEGATSQDSKTGMLRFKVSFMMEKDK